MKPELRKKRELNFQQENYSNPIESWWFKDKFRQMENWDGPKERKIQNRGERGNFERQEIESPGSFLVIAWVSQNGNEAGPTLNKWTGEPIVSTPKKRIGSPDQYGANEKKDNLAGEKGHRGAKEAKYHKKARNRSVPIWREGFFMNAMKKGWESHPKASRFLRRGKKGRLTQKRCFIGEGKRMQHSNRDKKTK